MLKISDITWMHKEFTNLNALAALLKDGMKKELKLDVNIHLIDKSLVFNIVKEDKIMVSTVKNKILLPKDSKRAKELGREYLHSERPTEKQHKGFFSYVQDSLDNLGLSASVDYTDSKTGRTNILRRAKEKMNWTPTVTSFTVEA